MFQAPYEGLCSDPGPGSQNPRHLLERLRNFLRSHFVSRPSADTSSKVLYRVLWGEFGRGVVYG